MASMKKYIERKCSKFVSCFKPVDRARLKGGSVNMEDDTTIIPKASDDVFVGTRRRSRKNMLSKIVKAVLFETSLAKKIGAKKLRKTPFQSSSSASTNSEKSFIINQTSAPYKSSSDEDNDSEKMTSTWSLPSTHTSTLSEDNKVNSIGAKRNRECWNFAMGLIFISLLILLFWGRFFVIFSTSAWLIFWPSRSRLYGRSSGVLVGLPEFDSLKYKKRVIMEGFLRRNHTRVL